MNFNFFGKYKIPATKVLERVKRTEKFGSFECSIPISGFIDSPVGKLALDHPKSILLRNLQMESYLLPLTFLMKLIYT